MSAQRNYRADLWQALADWKDAGGSIADVVAAIDAFVQSKIDRAADQPKVALPKYHPGTCPDCGVSRVAGCLSADCPMRLSVPATEGPAK